MSLIECKLGPTTQHVLGRDYAFEKDKYGRFVCRVADIAARVVFLHVEHYVEVPEHVEEKPKRAPRRAADDPPGLSGAGGEPQTAPEPQPEPQPEPPAEPQPEPAAPPAPATRSRSRKGQPQA